MMFRLLPAAAMTATALATMTAGAATVDVYGVVDTGLHYVKADSGDTSVTMDSGISKGSRVGLIGSEDLGGGYKIVFNLETGFRPQTAAPSSFSANPILTHGACGIP